jgi:hypothetical protein
MIFRTEVIDMQQHNPHEGKDLSPVESFIALSLLAFGISMRLWEHFQLGVWL